MRCSIQPRFQHAQQMIALIVQAEMIPDHPVARVGNNATGIEALVNALALLVQDGNGAIKNLLPGPPIF